MSVWHCVSIVGTISHFAENSKSVNEKIQNRKAASASDYRIFCSAAIYKCVGAYNVKLRLETCVGGAYNVKLRLETCVAGAYHVKLRLEAGTK